MMEALTQEMMASDLSQWIQATYWLWPILEIFHFFGLTLLMGGLILVDLRMIGLFSDIGLEEVKKLLPFVIFGFLVNLVTGVLFLFGDPSRYLINIGFQVKMILVVLAGCNAAIYHLKVESLFSNLNLIDRLPLAIKITGFTSLVLWLSLIHI